jgi:hypothetical protein
LEKDRLGASMGKTSTKNGEGMKREREREK